MRGIIARFVKMDGEASGMFQVEVSGTCWNAIPQYINTSSPRPLSIKVIKIIIIYICDVKTSYILNYTAATPRHFGNYQRPSQAAASLPRRAHSLQPMIAVSDHH